MVSRWMLYLTPCLGGIGFRGTKIQRLEDRVYIRRSPNSAMPHQQNLNRVSCEQRCLVVSSRLSPRVARLVFFHDGGVLTGSGVSSHPSGRPSTSASHCHRCGQMSSLSTTPSPSVSSSGSPVGQRSLSAKKVVVSLTEVGAIGTVSLSLSPMCHKARAGRRCPRPLRRRGLRTNPRCSPHHRRHCPPVHRRRRGASRPHPPSHRPQRS